MKSPYDELYNSQIATWDAVEVEDVSTLYYHGGEGIDMSEGADIVEQCAKNNVSQIYRGPHKRSWRLGFQCTDGYYYMAGKFKEALDAAFKIPHTKNFDIIFRTNSSSYVNIKRIKEFAETLPKEKLYAGWTMVDSEDHGGLVVSGAGIFLSRDTAQILMEQIDPSVEREEDIEIGRILRRNGIVAIDDKSRFDVNEINDDIPLDRYHYRFKGPHGNRLIDSEYMEILHKKIISG